MTSGESESTAYWSRVARTKTFTHPLDLDLIDAHLPRDGAVLDLGCGYGRLTAELHDAGWPNVCGADRASGMIEAARERRPDLAFTRLTDDALPWSAAHFDAVLLFSVLTCIPEAPAQDHLLAEIRRVLRPNGLLYVSDLFLQTDERNVDRYRDGLRRFGTHGVFELDEGVRLRHFEAARIDELLRGFQVVDRREREFVTMNGNRAHGFQILGRLPGAA